MREAIDSNTLRRVAVKISDKRRLRKVRGAEEQQKREIAVQRKLSHRGVVEVIEVFTLPEKPDKMYIVLELVTGGSLQALLESYADGRLPLCLCHRLFAQLLDALEHCHAKGVIHRDIKPANLMITADGQLKVSDFGSAEMIGPYLSEDTLTKSSGTPAFHRCAPPRGARAAPAAHARARSHVCTRARARARPAPRRRAAAAAVALAARRWRRARRSSRA